MSNVNMNHIIAFVRHKSATTCNGRTAAQYLKGLVHYVAKIQRTPISDTAMVPLIVKGLRKGAPPVQHARPLTPESFTNLINKLDLYPNLQLASLILMLGGLRVDELFRITPRMIHTVQPMDLQPQLIKLTSAHVFTIIATKEESKTGFTDPEALRFVDVVLLSKYEWKALLDLASEGESNIPIFGNRSQLRKQLTRQGFSDHSFKRGVSDLLSIAVRDSIVPEEVVALVLKHKSETERTPSTTAGYMTSVGRANIMQSKGAFRAAWWLRYMVCKDVPPPS